MRTHNSGPYLDTGGCLRDGYYGRENPDTQPLTDSENAEIQAALAASVPVAGFLRGPEAAAARVRARVDAGITPAELASATSLTTDRLADIESGADEDRGETTDLLRRFYSWRGFPR